jgi:hypothetical protein
MSVCSKRERARVPEAARGAAIGMAIVLGWGAWHGSASAANEGAGTSEERICPAGESASRIVVCFGDGGAMEEQEAVRAEVAQEFEALTRKGLGPEGGEQLLVRVDGAEPNLGFGVQPIGSDGGPLASGVKRLTQCGGERGCTSEEWREVVRKGMREALVELREDRERVTSEPAVGSPRVVTITST